MAPVETRAVRADAQRNRERLVTAARGAFASGEHKATLEGIARDAGVGIGTLYRHFPTREALVEAVYRAELARLCDSAAELLAGLEPAAALRAWMDRFAGYVAAKRDMADTLRVIVAAGTITTSQARERLAASVQVLLDAGVAAGTLRDDVLAQDVMVSLVGIFLACGRPEHSEQSEQAGRMMDLLMAGLRRQLAADPAVPGPAAS